MFIGNVNNLLDSLVMADHSLAVSEFKTVEINSIKSLEQSMQTGG